LNMHRLQVICAVTIMLCITKALALRITFDTTKIISDIPRSCTVQGGLYFRGPIGAALATQCEKTDATSIYSNAPLTTCQGTCDIQDVVTDQIYNRFINTTLPALQNKIQSVIDIKSNMRISNFTVPVVNCVFPGNDGINVTSSYSLNNTDLLIFVYMRPMPRSVGTQGLYCYRDPVSKRPLVGLLNVPVPILTYSDSTVQYLLLKQVMHILGFHWPILSKEIYQSEVKTTVVNGATRRTTYLDLPTTSRALAAIQAHSGCNDDTTTRIEMEDTQLAYNAYLYTSSDTTTSFLEKRVFFNEIMTNNFSVNVVISSDGQPGSPSLSNISLSILSDMPWYTVNSTNADPLPYGSNVGCALSSQQCENWIPASSDATSRLNWYWCDAPLPDKYCTFDLTSKGDCNVQSYSPLPKTIYQHFANPAYGGSDLVNDLCPFISPSLGGDCRVGNGQSADPQTGELYGSNSRCFMSNIRVNPQGSTQPSATSTCLNTACGPATNNTSADTTLFVQIGAIWYKCDPAGGKANGLSGALGTLYCPPVDLLCPAGKTSTNWNPSIAVSAMDAEKSQVPWWAWLILGLGLGIPLLLLFLVIVGVFAWKEMKKREKITVVDLRNKPRKARK